MTTQTNKTTEINAAVKFCNLPIMLAYELLEIQGLRASDELLSQEELEASMYAMFAPDGIEEALLLEALISDLMVSWGWMLYTHEGTMQEFYAVPPACFNHLGQQLSEHFPMRPEDITDDVWDSSKDLRLQEKYKFVLEGEDVSMVIAELGDLLFQHRHKPICC